MADPRPHRKDYRIVRTINGLNPTLWRWVRARATLEHRGTGEILNEIIGRYRQEADFSDTRIEITSPYEIFGTGQHSVRGIDPHLWRWLRSRSILEEYLLSELLNELLYRYMTTAGEAVKVVRTRYQECVICQRLYETEREDSLACSNRCRVALHRRRRNGQMI